MLRSLKEISYFLIIPWILHCITDQLIFLVERVEMNVPTCRNNLSGFFSQHIVEKTKIWCIAFYKLLYRRGLGVLLLLLTSVLQWSELHTIFFKYFFQFRPSRPLCCVCGTIGPLISTQLRGSLHSLIAINTQYTKTRHEVLKWKLVKITGTKSVIFLSDNLELKQAISNAIIFFSNFKVFF